MVVSFWRRSFEELSIVSFLISVELLYWIWTGLLVESLSLSSELSSLEIFVERTGTMVERTGTMVGTTGLTWTIGLGWVTVWGGLT